MSYTTQKIATTPEVLPNFKTGQEYLAKNSKSFKITIIKRTAKTVTFALEVDGEESPFGVSTKRIKVINGSEYFFDGISEYYANQTEVVAEVMTETAPQPQSSQDDQLTELVALQELLISKVEEVNQLKLKIAELQVVVDEAKHSQRQTQKAKIAQIVLSRDERTIAESGTTVTAAGWLKA